MRAKDKSREENRKCFWLEATRDKGAADLLY